MAVRVERISEPLLKAVKKRFKKTLKSIKEPEPEKKKKRKSFKRVKPKKKRRKRKFGNYIDAKRGFEPKRKNRTVYMSDAAHEVFKRHWPEILDFFERAAGHITLEEWQALQGKASQANKTPQS